ncbi:hypothetical protein HOD75_01635 [archaeon]|jgi:hypothetical protein|nr:hypothetical protein [archaeon]MBT4241580.1 hypothetical protein [archaeon]MBT4417975.1 hypothetical protein [archaeon]
MKKRVFWIIGISLLIIAGAYKFLDFPYFNILGGIIGVIIALLVIYSTLKK